MFDSGSGTLFGQWLVDKGVINHDDLCAALAEQGKAGGRLGEVLTKLKHITGTEIVSALAEYLDMEFMPLEDLSIIDFELARKIPESLAKRFVLLAIRKEADGSILVAMDDPLNVVAIDTVRLKTKSEIKIAVSSRKKILEIIDNIYHGSSAQEQQLRTLVEGEFEDEHIIDTDDDDVSGLAADITSEAEASRAPVIRFVDLLLSQAVKSRASDVHIEPQEKSMSIRMRIDGVLREMVPPSRKMQSAVLARIKILSKLNIAERRLPQDGRLRIKAADHDIDVRVSTIPTIYGEKIVMRILDTSSVNHNIESIGFEPELLEQFKRVLTQPHGIIIVTGPTGSGKSTTLYSALNHLRDPGKNITTVEDPVEYRLGGINQIQVKPEIGLDFASCLRSILRQDPDIVLIGEIRDKETMEIAIKASLTGHLVLSTFHTNDAPSTFTRLSYMGLEKYLLASTINLVIAQRLVRRICPQCKEQMELEPYQLKELKLTEEQASEITFYQGKGCSNCNKTGYLGRTPIFEFLLVDNNIRQAVIKGSDESVLRKISHEAGFGGLLESGVSRIKQGLTTPEEVLKVTFTDISD